MHRLILILLLCGTAFTTQAQSIEANSLSAESQLVWDRVLALNSQIFTNKDSLKIEPFLHPDLQYMHSNSKLENKRQMMHNAAVSKTVYRQLSHELIRIKFLKGIALVRYNLKTVSVENGKETPFELGIIQVWTKEKGKWLLIERQAVRLAALSS